MHWITDVHLPVLDYKVNVFLGIVGVINEAVSLFYEYARKKTFQKAS